ncbi:hypothetical protein EfmAA290_09770 [Enterococcus faecium]|nr:hypothetical protein EfmAA290_09770 [Enterococcus faecium]
MLEQTTETDIHHLQAAANVAMIYLSKGELDQEKINEIQSLNSVSKYQESYKILQTIDQEKVSNSDLLNQILFYQGLLDHLYAKKPDAALFYFNQVLENDRNRYPSLTSSCKRGNDLLVKRRIRFCESLCGAYT